MEHMSFWQETISGVGALVAVWLYIQLFSSIGYDLDLEKETVGIYIDPAPFLEQTAKTMVFGARGFADVSYDAILYDQRSGALIIDGLSISHPNGDGRIARITVSSIADDGSEMDLRFEIDGVEIDLASLALPPAAAPAIAIFGSDQIVASAVIEVAYDFAESDALVRASYEIDGLGRVYSHAELVDLHLDSTADDEPLRGGLAAIEIAFENDGAVELALEAMGQGELTEAQARAMMAGAAQGVIGWFAGADEDPNANIAGVGEGPRAFAADIEDALVDLAVSGDSIAISVAPDEPIDLFQLSLVDGLRTPAERRAAALELLQPEVGPRPSLAVEPISLITLEALNAAAPAERARMIEALITGVGAPRNLDLAIEAAAGSTDDASVRLMAAKALRARGGDGDDAAAFEHAVAAAAAGEPGASALIAEVTQDMPASEILAIEAAAAGQPSAAERALRDAAESGDVSAMRQLAVLYEAGRGAPRSLSKAYRWAVLAAASGDRAGARMRERMAALFAGGSDADQAAWAEVIAAEEASAAALWNGGLGALVAAR